MVGVSNDELVLAYTPSASPTRSVAPSEPESAAITRRPESSRYFTSAAESPTRRSRTSKLTRS